MNNACGPTFTVFVMASCAFNIAVCIAALWELLRPRFRRSYRALFCRRHGLFNADGSPFCPVCDQTLEPVTLFRQKAKKYHAVRRSGPNPTRRSDV